MNALHPFFTRKERELGVTLNDIQRQAVLQTEGPLLLLASPGSGKTTTIIMRICYLIEEKGIDPARIKAVTFSRASASDMKARFQKFFPELPSVDFSTIHSFAFEVVRHHFWTTGTPYRIIEGDLDPEELELESADGSDQPPLHKKLILRHLFKTIAGENITDDQLEELTTYISYIKNKMIPEAEWAQVKTDVPEAERILREYEAFKQSPHHPKLLLDFDDMLTIAERALRENDSLLRRFERRYDYVLTDESQDTSLVQHAIVEKLVRSHRNLCVVADDDQSIYSWRGAEPSYLLNFKRTYPTAVTLFMERNYRSTRQIVRTANAFIKRNKKRYAKNMFTENEAGEPIKLKTFADYIYQAKYVVEEVRQCENLAEAAVLYRNNSSSIILMNEFDRAGIPFYMKDADNRFFNHWVVEDILNFMRMTFTDRRPDILEQIHSKMSGYITKRQMAELLRIANNESVFDNLLQFVPLQGYQVKLLTEAKETFREMRGLPPKEAIRVIRGRLGYEKAIEKMCKSLGFRKDYLIGILNTLEEIADTLQTMEEFAARLKHLEAALKTAKSRKGQNAVTFSTFHSAKGLEFERVYMVDLVEGIIPSSDDADDDDLMEEATRLFYVGMTRAKRHLELIAYRKRDDEKTAPSRFASYVSAILNPAKEAVERSSSDRRKRAAHPSASAVKLVAAEVPVNPNAIRVPAELETGKEVKHRAFGIGTIVKVNEVRIHIRFGHSEKALSVTACLEAGLLEPV
ncbi:ATP-dependent helicase [Cohnella lubricantis]|uniref:DNA 3'-5' helicase n=1 Tax=Cohnella lubricantis TaxID=2163172 RepID=A0A841TB39_9BACL|nr:ATP-dependent helicase [Cohnella lubricantis]MBB6678514.1 ATP-dependent helicase [Cohnella lubricantis]